MKQFTLRPVRFAAIQKADALPSNSDTFCKTWAEAHGLSDVLEVYISDDGQDTYVSRLHPGGIYNYYVRYHPNAEEGLAPYHVYRHVIYGKDLQFVNGVSHTFSSVDDANRTICRVTVEHDRGFRSRGRDRKHLRYQFLWLPDDDEPRKQWPTAELGTDVFKVEIDQLRPVIKVKLFELVDNPTELFERLDELHSAEQAERGIE